METYLIMITEEVGGTSQPYMLASTFNEAHELIRHRIKRTGKVPACVDLYIQYNGTFQLRTPSMFISEVA